MLFYKAIDAATLELLTKLQKIPLLKDTRLVGGTALAIQIGHRKSVDIDLFGNIKGDELSLSKKLQEIGTTQIIRNTENIHIYLVKGIKVDIVNYHYPWLGKPVVQDGHILAGQKDIAAMKLSAVTGRGSKKDFIDIYYLLKKYSLSEMMSFYLAKYHDGSEFMVLKSITYFSDADADKDPVMLKLMDWRKVKETILRAVEKHVMK